jgi:uncharacterized surface protein with fasciclin (FAS1) repeats
MKKPVLIVAALLAISLLSNTLFAQTATTTTAAPPAATGDVVTVMTSSDNYSAFSIAIRAAALNSTLEGAGPYTVFAPTNDAIGKTSSGKLDSLFKDPAALAANLKTYVVSGKYTRADIIKALGASKDKTTTFKTVDGRTLTLTAVSIEGHTRLQITDDQGNKAIVGFFDAAATNGVVHGLTSILKK